MIKPAILTLILTVFGAGGAAACSPAEMKVSSRAIKGEACAISYVISPYERVGLAEAQDLGGGFVMQPTFEGNACMGAVSMIVAQCKSGEVAILGESLQTLMEPNSLRPMAQLEAALGQKDLTLDKARAAARRVGLTKMKAARLSDKIKMGGKTFDLSCGCKMFY